MSNGKSNNLFLTTSPNPDEVKKKPVYPRTFSKYVSRLVSKKTIETASEATQKGDVKKPK